MQEGGIPSCFTFAHIIHHPFILQLLQRRRVESVSRTQSEAEDHPRRMFHALFRNPSISSLHSEGEALTPEHGFGGSACKISAHLSTLSLPLPSLH